MRTLISSCEWRDFFVSAMTDSVTPAFPTRTMGASGWARPRRYCRCFDVRTAIEISFHALRALQELLRRLEAGQPGARGFIAFRVDEHDRRHAKDRILPGERLGGRILGGRQVRLHADEAIELAHHPRVGE